MATRKTTTRHTFRRHVAPFAPVALALAMNAVNPGQQQTTANTTPPPADNQIVFAQSCAAPHFPSDTPTSMDETSCTVAGNGGKETFQNEAKNNFCAPDPAKPVTLAEMIALQATVQQDSNINFGNPRSHPLSNTAGPATNRAPLQKLGEGDEVVLQGFVLIARQEGAESVNCGKNVPDDPVDHDIHISIVQNPSDAECDGIVAEMTPHHRPPEWNPATLKAVSDGKLPVRITGQRMFDSSHSPCINGSSVSGDPKRASLWEVHPIYKFEVCPQGDCANGGWVPLELWKKG